jgi:3-oxoacyl-[acyl-carrier protein] reductase
MNICITGSNGKLGSSLSNVCKSNSWNVIEHGGTRMGDLLDEQHLADFSSSLPQLDCLICCAGGKSADVDFESFEAMMYKNLFTAYLSCKHIIPKMKRQSTILTIGSVDGCFGSSEGSFYAAAKAALHIYSRCLSKQLGSKEINVNCLAIGTLTNDNILSIANSIVPFCRYSSLNGQVIRIDQGHHTFAC